VVNGDLIGMVHAERCGMRCGLYVFPDKTYRLRFNLGVGWLPTPFRENSKAWTALFNTASYSDTEVEMLRKICKPQPY